MTDRTATDLAQALEREADYCRRMDLTDTRISSDGEWSASERMWRDAAALLRQQAETIARFEAEMHKTHEAPYGELKIDPHIHGPYPLPSVPAGTPVEVRWRSENGAVHFFQVRDHGVSWGIDQRGDRVDALEADLRRALDGGSTSMANAELATLRARAEAAEARVARAEGRVAAVRKTLQEDGFLQSRRAIESWLAEKGAVIQQRYEMADVLATFHELRRALAEEDL